MSQRYVTGMLGECQGVANRHDSPNAGRMAGSSRSRWPALGPSGPPGPPGPTLRFRSGFGAFWMRHGRRSKIDLARDFQTIIRSARRRRSGSTPGPDPENPPKKGRSRLGACAAVRGTSRLSSRARLIATSTPPAPGTTASGSGVWRGAPSLPELCCLLNAEARVFPRTTSC